MTYKFRGYRTDGCGWHYGDKFKWKKYGKEKIIIGEGVQNGSVIGFEVHPESVGQWTGQTDQNGVEIYKGDYVDVFNREGENFLYSGNYMVYWLQISCAFILTDKTTDKGIWFSDTDIYTVTGNAFQDKNPALFTR